MACRAFPLSDVKVHVPPESLTAIQRTQVEGLQVDVTPEPAIFSRDVALSVPGLEHPVPDDVNLWAALELSPGRIDFEVQRALSNLLRRFEKAGQLTGEMAARMRLSPSLRQVRSGWGWLSISVPPKLPGTFWICEPAGPWLPKG